MKRIYTKAQLEKKANKRAARLRKTTKEIHPIVTDKIYTLRIVSPMQCVDSINSVLSEKKATVTKFGNTHMVVTKINEKDCKELATELRNCKVTTEHGRTFKPIVCCEKYKDVTPKKKKEKKPSNNTIDVKIAAKDRRKYSNVCRNTNRNSVRIPRRTKKIISLFERRLNLRKAA
jgi:hypothetical protein